MTSDSPHDRAPAWALPAVLAVAAGMAVAFFPLPADDAYIVARYVVQLYAGRGLVYNEGEFVNALTSPLHLGVLVLLRSFADDFVTVYRVVSVAAVMVLLSVLAWRKWGPGVTAAVFLALTLGCPFVAAWMGGGLETPLLLCACTAVAFLALSPALPDDPARAAWLVALAALAILIRYDASLFVTPVALYGVWMHRQRARVWIAAAAGALVVLAWIAFTIVYYGDPLPTSFYVKAGGPRSLDEASRGLLYVASFLCLTWLWLPLAAGRADTKPSPPAGARRALWTGVGLTLVYGVFASTKHMMYSYRLLVPFLPALAILILSCRPSFPRRAPLLLGALLVAQAALAFFIHGYSQNPSLSLVAEGTSDARERFEFSHLGARHVGTFLATLPGQAASIREHWARTGLAGSRAPRVIVSTGGLLPYLLPDAYVLEQLVSYRHRCRAGLEPLGDYLQVIYSQSEADVIARERARQGRETIARWTFVADGLRDEPLPLAVEVWYRPSTLPLPFPATIGEPCTQ